MDHRRNVWTSYGLSVAPFEHQTVAASLFLPTLTFKCNRQPSMKPLHRPGPFPFMSFFCWIQKRALFGSFNPWL